jgi:hypothetical protein
MPDLACRSAWLLAMLAAIAPAQDVTLTVTTATDVVARAGSGVPGQVAQGSVPANTVTVNNVNATSAWYAGTAALSTWSGGASQVGGHARWDQRVDVAGAWPAFASASGELLVHVTATSAAPLRIELTRVVDATPGAASPAFSVDVGDDGFFELQAAGLGSTVITGIAAGAQPVPIRMRSTVAQTGQGFAAVTLDVRVLPDNAIAVNPVLPPCDLSTLLLANPVFEQTGVRFEVTTSALVVLVLGLAPQPQPIPSPFAGCLLLPSPDALQVLTYGQNWTLGVPAAVRPVTVWAQGVVLESTGLATTSSYVLLAN